MAIAKIEPLPKFDFGEKLLEWKQRRHAEGKELRRAVRASSARRVEAAQRPARPLEKLLAESNKVLETFVRSRPTANSG